MVLLSILLTFAGGICLPLHHLIENKIYAGSVKKINTTIEDLKEKRKKVDRLFVSREIRKHISFGIGLLFIAAAIFIQGCASIEGVNKTEFNEHISNVKIERGKMEEGMQEIASRITNIEIFLFGEGGNGGKGDGGPDFPPPSPNGYIVDLKNKVSDLESKIAGLISTVDSIREKMSIKIEIENMKEDISSLNESLLKIENHLSVTR